MREGELAMTCPDEELGWICWKFMKSDAQVALDKFVWVVCCSIPGNDVVIRGLCW